MALSYVLWFGSAYLGFAFYTLVLFAGIFGFSYGLYLASFPGLLAEFFGVRNLGFVMGRSYTAGGVGAIIGLPLLGFMLDIKVDLAVVSLLMLVLGIVSYLIVMSLTPGKAGAVEVRPQTGS
jgi:MFS family permease